MFTWLLRTSGLICNSGQNWSQKHVLPVTKSTYGKKTTKQCQQHNFIKSHEIHHLHQWNRRITNSILDQTLGHHTGHFLLLLPVVQWIHRCLPAHLRTRLKEAPSSFRATRNVILSASHVAATALRWLRVLSQAKPRTRTVSFCARRSFELPTTPCSHLHH